MSLVSPFAKSDPSSLVDLHPPAPRTLAEAGLGEDLVTQLILKLLNFGANMTGLDIAQRLGLEFSAIESVLEQIKQTHQCEVLGASAIGGPTYQYRITDAGRRRALLFLEQSHYVGVAPVPLAQYQAYMESHRRAAALKVSRARVRQALSHLVLSDKVLDQIGPAVAAGHSMFVYGPAGNGKTVIAQAIGNLVEGELAIPHAIEVEGQIIRIFDPVNHQPLENTDTSGALDWVRRDERDARWVRCRRPTVVVGGELTMRALELTFSKTLGYYTAPIQAVANGGVLVIDDFGRQSCSPRDLLNRWIVPLESRVDFLTLHTGHKFALPFNVLVVFATNIRPSELVDDAFLRRIHNKIMAEPPTVDDFRLIFKRYCHDRDLHCDEQLLDDLLAKCLRPRGAKLRGCVPRDLIDQALAHADYLGVPRELNIDLLEAACASYFVDDDGAVTI
jgi:predicted ATPase with chaperone activity